MALVHCMLHARSREHNQPHDEGAGTVLPIHASMAGPPATFGRLLRGAVAFTAGLLVLLGVLCYLALGEVTPESERERERGMTVYSVCRIA